MSAAWHGGKGTRPRPKSVDLNTFDANWDAIFSKSNKVEEQVSKAESNQNIDSDQPNNNK